MAYNEITMTLEERKAFIEQNRDKFSPERLLAVVKRLNNDRVAEALPR